MSSQADVTTRKARQLAGYQRTLDAEPRLAPIVRMVDALCVLVRRTDRLCYGCVWEGMVKPLVSPLVGWGRGYPPKVAEDPDPSQPAFRLVSAAEVLARREARVPATTDTEGWLRTSEAFDAFTDVLLDRLERADPGNGHGIGRCSRRPAS